MQAVAKLKNCPMSARKMRLAVDLVRNKPVSEALSILEYTKKEAAVWLHKLLRSAVNNWEQLNEDSADSYDLYVSEIFCDQGAQLKRFRPAPHGRAHRIRKHSCHVTIKVMNAKALELASSDENKEE